MKPLHLDLPNHVTLSVQSLLQELTPLALVAFLLLLKVSCCLLRCLLFAFYAAFCLSGMIVSLCQIEVSLWSAVLASAAVLYACCFVASHLCILCAVQTACHAECMSQNIRTIICHR